MAYIPLLVGIAETPVVYECGESRHNFNLLLANEIHGGYMCLKVTYILLLVDIVETPVVYECGDTTQNFNQNFGYNYLIHNGN